MVKWTWTRQNVAIETFFEMKHTQLLHIILIRKWSFYILIQYKYENRFDCRCTCDNKMRFQNIQMNCVKFILQQNVENCAWSWLILTMNNCWLIKIEIIFNLTAYHFWMRNAGNYIHDRRFMNVSSWQQFEQQTHMFKQCTK